MRPDPIRPKRACFVRKWCTLPNVTLETPHSTLHSSNSTLHTPHFISSNLSISKLISPHLSSSVRQKAFTVSGNLCFDKNHWIFLVVTSTTTSDLTKDDQTQRTPNFFINTTNDIEAKPKISICFPGTLNNPTTLLALLALTRSACQSSS